MAVSDPKPKTTVSPPRSSPLVHATDTTPKDFIKKYPRPSNSAYEQLWPRAGLRDGQSIGSWRGACQDEKKFMAQNGSAKLSAAGWRQSRRLAKEVEKYAHELQQHRELHMVLQRKLAEDDAMARGALDDKVADSRKQEAVEQAVEKAGSSEQNAGSAAKAGSTK